MSVQWETIEVPRGQFIGWGNRPGQTVVGKVLSYSIAGGTDANGKECPELALELIEDAVTYRQRATIQDTIAAGEMVVLTCGGVSLKRSVIAAQPKPGDLIKLTFSAVVPVTTPNGPGEVKEFTVQVARGAGGPAKPAATDYKPEGGQFPTIRPASVPSDPWSAPQTQAPPF